MPPGVCVPPVCWDLQYTFNNQVLVIKPKDAAAKKWAKSVRLPANQFAALVNAFTAKWNAQARSACGANCVCVRLHKKRLTFRYEPQFLGPHPNGLTHIYMDGITATGWLGLCAMKGWIRIKVGGEWVPVEKLKEPDIIKFPSSPGGGGKKKKKAKKAAKATRAGARRSR